MSSIPSILFLRLKQVQRAIVQAGLGVILLAILVTFGMAMQIIVALREMDWPTVGLISLVIAWAIQASRKDLLFLRSICKNRWSFRSILAAEYLLLLFPLILLFSWDGRWLQMLAVTIAPFITALTVDLIPISSQRQTKKSLLFIPSKNFEIKSRVEKNPFLFSFIYSLSYFSFFHIAFFPVSIIIISTFLVDIFKYFEPSTMVHWHKSFVFEKTIRNVGLLFLAYLPPFLLTMFFQWEFKWVAVYAIVILITVTVLAICFKYANYTPLYPDMKNSNTIGFLLLLSFLPGFILITMGYSFVQYFKAKKNMDYYFGK